MILINFSITLLSFKVKLVDQSGSRLKSLITLTDDADGLEHVCIDLGDQRHGDVSLGFEYVKGGWWINKKYGGQERSAVDNVDVTYGTCSGTLCFRLSFGLNSIINFVPHCCQKSCHKIL